MKVLGIVLIVIGSILLLGALRNSITVFNSTDGHALSKFFGGLGLSALITLLGFSLYQKSKSS